MAKRSFSRRVVRKIKRILKPDEAKNIIEKEFEDSHNNKIKFRFDFNPHSTEEPTIKWQRNHGDNKWQMF